MKKSIHKLLHHKKILLTLGIVVSLLVLHQNNIYSSTEIQKFVPEFEQMKEKVGNHFSSESNNGTNLTNGNFIASYISVISGKSDDETKKPCEKSNAFSTIKNKVVEAFSIL